MEELGIVLTWPTSPGPVLRCPYWQRARPWSPRQLLPPLRTPRNLTDKQLKLLAEKGGVMGINFYRRSSPGQIRQSDQLLDHFVHAASVAGVEHVGIGSDFDGISESVEQLDHAACYPALLAGLRAAVLASGKSSKLPEKM